MRSRPSGPGDLASLLENELRRRGEGVDLAVLEDITETLYFASLRSEEGEPVRCQVAYLDPDNPDPDPPKRIVEDRWRVTPLGARLDLDVPNLVKLANATDPRTSSFAIHPDSEGRLQIWGLVDQGNRYYDFLNFDSESGPPPPGLFLASIDRPAEITARVGFDAVGTLRVDRLVVDAVDVFDSGPVRDALAPGIAAYLERTGQKVGDELFQDRGHWGEWLSRAWIEALCRILLRARQYGHGGALLVTPDETGTGVDIKYQLGYMRLVTALDSRATAVIARVNAQDDIFALMESEGVDLPMSLYLDEAVNRDREGENRSELDSTAWFISLLTRVDGLVLMTPELAVRGFGVEITASESPTTVRRAHDAQGGSTTDLSYTQYGTRHRSMMRYCWAVPGSVGFVISQDRDVRVIARRGDEIVVWENPLLQMQISDAGEADVEGDEPAESPSD